MDRICLTDTGLSNTKTKTVYQTVKRGKIQNSDNSHIVAPSLLSCSLSRKRLAIKDKNFHLRDDPIVKAGNRKWHSCCSLKVSPVTLNFTAPKPVSTSDLRM